MESHTTCVLARPVDIIPDTRYVKGETRYIKIQNPGRAVGLARTPQKMRQRENIRLATFPAFSAESMPAMMKSVKVDVKRRKAQMKANMRPLRSLTALVISAFRERPMG